MVSEERAQEILAAVKEVLEDDLKAVTFKWLARRFSVPADTAKRLLWQLQAQPGAAVSATYLLAGWTRAAGAEPPRHLVRLVEDGGLAAAQAGLDPVTAVHVYSLQPSAPRASAQLWTAQRLQTTELFRALLLDPAADNCLADNRWSSISNASAAWNPALARKLATRPAPGAAPVGPVAAAMQAAVQGPARAAASEPARPSQPQAAAPAKAAASQPAPAGAAKTEAALPDPATALEPPPVQQPQQRVGGHKPPPDVGAKKADGKAGLAAMWAKAPPAKASKSAPAAAKGGKKAGAGAKKKAPAAAGKKGGAKAAPVQALDADAAIREAQEEAGSDSGDEGDGGARLGMASNKSRLLLESSDDEEAPVPVAAKPAPAAQAKGSGGRKGQILLSDSDGDADEEGAWPSSTLPATRAPAEPAAGGAKDSRAEAAAGADEEEEGAPAKKKKKKRGRPRKSAGEEEEEEEGAQEGPAPAKKKERKEKEKPRPGTVKAAPADGGAKRRKVVQAIINERGEEVTEEVWVEEAGSQEPGEDPPGAAAAAPKGTASAPAAASPRKAHADGAVKVVGSPRGVPKGGGAAGGAAKRGGKAGRGGAGQRGIQSFFSKKT